MIQSNYGPSLWTINTDAQHIFGFMASRRMVQAKGAPIPPLNSEALQRVLNRRRCNLSVKVSSKHLALASPVSKAMFSSGLKESSQLQRGGATQVLLPEDCPEGMAILLYILHGKFRLLPAKMTPHLLIQIALMVDKYHLHESVEPLACTWFEDVWSHIPVMWDPYIFHWIAMSRVFNREVEFKSLTAEALEQCPERARMADLPIGNIRGVYSLDISYGELRLNQAQKLLKKDGIRLLSEQSKGHKRSSTSIQEGILV